MSSLAWIGLGGNLGDREATLDAAVAALAEGPGVVVEAVSPYRETRPVGGPGGQGAFLNAAARVMTTLEPRGLLALAHRVEDRLGRVRAVRWGERTLDVDLLIFEGLTLETPELTLPHPRMAFRRFVLGPLAEIDRDLLDPATGRTIGELLARLDRRPRLLAVEGHEGARKDSVVRGLVDALPAFEIGGGSTEDRPAFPWLLLASPPGPDVPEPLLIVDLAASPGGRAGFGLRAVPRLRPLSDEPEGIVEEVVATCRAIEVG